MCNTNVRLTQKTAPIQDFLHNEKTNEQTNNFMAINWRENNEQKM